MTERRNLSIDQHHCVVGNATKLIGVVGDPHDRDAIGGNLETKVFNGSTSFVVERSGWFVSQQDRRIGEQRTSDTHALSFSPAEISGPPLQQMSAEANVLKNMLGSILTDARLGNPEVCEHITIEDGRPLEDHPDLTSQARRLPITQRASVE